MRTPISRASFSPQAQGCLEIRLLNLTTGTRHRSAAVPAIQLELAGKYDTSFGTLIEVIGDNLVVLVSHGSTFRHYQTLYFIDWVRGQVKCVSPLHRLGMAPLTALVVPALQWRQIFSKSNVYIKRHFGIRAQTRLDVGIVQDHERGRRRRFRFPDDLHTQTSSYPPECPCSHCKRQENNIFYNLLISSFACLGAPLPKLAFRFGLVFHRDRIST